MKICFIAPKAYQLFNEKVKSTFGGAEVQLSLLAKEISQDRKFEVNFMVADYGQGGLENYNNVRVWKSLNFKDNIFKQIYNFFKIFKKINADIYIQRTLTPQSGLISLYCKFRRKKFIYMVAHDSETDGTHKIYKNKFKSFFANLTFKLANKIIVQNEYQKNNILKRYNKLPEKLDSSYEIKKIKEGNKNGVLWVGRSEDWKRPELFLELAKEFSEEKFIMICPPSTNQSYLSKEIESKAEKIKNLIFYKFIPFKEIDEFFHNAKLFVNTSTQEGFPNTFIQAAKNKTPILSLNVDPDNFIEKFNCGFYCNNDFNTLNSKIKDVMNNEKLYNHISENAYRYVKENHNIKINVNKFLKIILK
jgi:glycosyltransferase involved in cell wall biosynthesis